MFRKILLCAVLLLAGPAAMAASTGSAAGVWETATGGYVQVYKNDDGSWEGRVVGSSDGKARYDNKNPDKAEKGRRLLGVVVLEGLKAQGNGSYKGGTIYDPNNGKSYSAKAEVKGPDTLDVRGYIGFSLIGKSQTWKRIDPKAEHVHQDLLHQPIPPGPQS